MLYHRRIFSVTLALTVLLLFLTSFAVADDARHGVTIAVVEENVIEIDDYEVPLGIEASNQNHSYLHWILGGTLGLMSIGFILSLLQSHKRTIALEHEYQQMKGSEPPCA